MISSIYFCECITIATGTEVVAMATIIIILPVQNDIILMIFTDSQACTYKHQI